MSVQKMHPRADRQQLKPTETTHQKMRQHRSPTMVTLIRLALRQNGLPALVVGRDLGVAQVQAAFVPDVGSDIILRPPGQIPSQHIALDPKP